MAIKVLILYQRNLTDYN